MKKTVQKKAKAAETKSKEVLTAEVKLTEVKPVVKTESDIMWDSIKNKDLFLFGMSNQKVSDHAERVNLSPTQLHLKVKSGMVIPALDSLLNTFKDGMGGEKRIEQYDVEQTRNGFVVITRKNDAVK